MLFILIFINTYLDILNSSSAIFDPLAQSMIFSIILYTKEFVSPFVCLLACPSAKI